ncbi:MAG: glucokinase [Sphingomonadales bacterium]|nr:MAG: glucokinase [Sphingomonadales bacterium]
MKQAIVGDIGGTHARFALAACSGDGGLTLSHTAKLKTADHTTLEAAYREYAASLPVAAPRRAVIAVATAVGQDEIRFTNNPWTFRRTQIAQNLGLERVDILNDFGAIARSIPYVGSEHLVAVRDTGQPLPEKGVISVVGPGTGLGVAMLVRQGDRDTVIETEGGHIGFAPFDRVEQEIARRLLGRFLRVSVERLVSGPGFLMVYEGLAAIEGHAIVPVDDRTLWTKAIDGSDTFARAALERFCAMLGSALGDYALAQGAQGVVIAGGLVPRFIDVLKASPFLSRFQAKGRFETMMQTIPIFVCTHPEPGLLGAATSLLEGHDHA